MWYATATWRATRATDDGKTNGKHKNKQVVGREKKEEKKKMRATSSSSPLYFFHTDVQLVICPIWRGHLMLGWFGHRDHDCEMEACICRRLSEEQPVFEVFPGNGSCNVALDVLLGHANGGGGSIRVCK